MRVMLALLLLWGSCSVSAAAQVFVPPSLQVDFPAGVSSVDLPARFDKENVMVSATIGTTSTYLALDTGASTMYLDTGFARQLGLTLTNQRGSGSYTTYSAVLPDLVIGPFHLHDVPVFVGPMPQGYVGIRPTGLLGNTFLAQFGVTVDYWNEHVRVVPFASFVPPTEPLMFTLDIRMRGNEPTTSLSIGGAVADNMIVDTGCGCQLLFFDSFGQKNPEAFHTFRGQMQGSTNVRGFASGKYYQIFDVQISNLHFQDFVATLVDNSFKVGDSDGLIGNELLALFTVYLDYADGKIYLVPTDATLRGIAKKH